MFCRDSTEIKKERSVRWCDALFLWPHDQKEWPIPCPFTGRLATCSATALFWSHDHSNDKHHTMAPFRGGSTGAFQALLS